MDVAQLILDYLTILLWPAIVVALLVIFHQPIAEALPRVRRAKAAGVEVELEAKERVNEALDAVDQVEDSREEVQLTRGDLEKIVRESAAAGWSVGRTSPSPSEPEAVVTWTGGKPSVTTWNAARGNVADRDRAREIEQQILEIDEIVGTGTVNFYTNIKLVNRRAALQRALRKVDPNSAFLD